jgi:hypothetical protein
VLVQAGLDCDSPICASLCSWHDKHMPLHPATDSDGSHKHFASVDLRGISS